MDDHEYERLKRMASDRRARVIREAEERFAETVAVIERFRELTMEEGDAKPKSEKPAPKSHKAKAKPAPAAPTKGPTAVVRQAIAAIPAKRFSSVDIRGWVLANLRVDLPGPALSSTLNKLNEQGEVRQVQKSAGRAPAIYERVSPSAAEDGKEADM